MNKTCAICGAALPTILDEFGDIFDPICCSCWLEQATESLEWYGMAPHHHDKTITGSLIGSTVLDPLPDPRADGWYEVEPGLLFQPDIETGGWFGIWRDER